MNMQYFILYKLNIFSALIFFILSFIILGYSVKLKDNIGMSFTYFSAFLLLHGAILFTEIFITFYPSTIYSSVINQESGIRVYLTWLNILSIMALLAAIFYCIKQKTAHYKNRFLLIGLSLLSGLTLVLVSWLFEIQDQYKLIYLLWSLYAICFWYINDVYLKTIWITHKYNVGQLLAIALLMSAVSELLTKSSLSYSLYSVTSGSILCLVFFLYLKRSEICHQAFEYQRLHQLIHDQHIQDVSEWSRALVQEIKTPLSNALLSCQLVNRLIDDEERQHTYIDRTEKSIQRAIKVSEDVLTYARFAENTRSQINVAASIRHTLSLLESQLRSFDMTTKVDEECTVFGDDELLQSVWEHLLTTVMDASQEEKTILIEVSGDKDHVYINIIDAGDRIADDIRHFPSPHLTTQGTEKQNLGFNLVNTIASIHQGEFHLFHDTQGTCAQIMLPRCKAI